MIEYGTGMQDGVQVVNIVVEVMLLVDHCRPPVSFRFRTKNELAGRQRVSSTRKKIFDVREGWKPRAEMLPAARFAKPRPAAGRCRDAIEPPFGRCRRVGYSGCMRCDRSCDAKAIYTRNGCSRKRGASGEPASGGPERVAAG